jgi:hypothetical protein
MESTQIITCVIVTACVLFAVYYLCKNDDKKIYAVPRVINKESYSSNLHKEKFYVYNYYKVPISVRVKELPKDSNDSAKVNDGELITLVEDVPSGKYKAVTQDKWKHLTQNSKVTIVKSEGTTGIIGESTMNIPEGKTIKALHCGMVSGQSDISILADITKSPLGTALPRLRIVNLGSRTLNLTTTGGNLLTIPPAKSLLYWGEYENGIHMGVTFKDVDGILPDFTLTKPITDLYLGIISDIEIPLYRAAKIGGDYFDDEGVFYHPLRELDGYQLHRGMFIDKSYIPRNW